MQKSSLSRSALIALLCVSSCLACSSPESKEQASEAHTSTRQVPEQGSNAEYTNIQQSSAKSTFSRVAIEENTEGIIGVGMSDTPNADYDFSVTIKSPDEGCEQYANWWEVITEDGTLLYRRILAHSHVDEQPFTRSGGPVEIGADEVVIVRSHMHPTGYHTQAMQGSFTAGFRPVTLPTDFAAELSETEPLPAGCSF